ncbi:hypothetical protein RhiirC2_739622 [Rhizophagus irregularis]|uniref:Uncharacterized protein n=1 Tax=Rhizophagus irregularis TaxID=588596 RepID=A0A2N1NJJ7_9GLOM|nr:hypothetical protein RhiirC2_739622 [Rhizophagus irregularis]
MLIGFLIFMQSQFLNSSNELSHSFLLKSLEINFFPPINLRFVYFVQFLLELLEFVLTK